MLPYAYEKKRTHPPIPERRRSNTSSMPRMKRSPLLWMAVIAFVIYVFYVATGNNHDMPFRTSTESRLTQSPDRKTDTSTFIQTTPEEIAHSMKDQGGHAIHPDIEKENLMKDLIGDKEPISESSSAPGKMADPITEAEEESVGVAGRIMMPKPKQEKPKYPLTTEDKSRFLIGEEEATNGGKPANPMDPATLEAKAELDDILKRSPIIIFSKSHCPYSARAKHLLLKTYNITPAPHVVELDLMTSPLRLSTGADAPTITMGRKIQDLLAEWTDRRTVPNILVNARSIGGSDDIARMDAEGKLVDEIKKLSMGRVREMVRNEAHED